MFVSMLAKIQTPLLQALGLQRRANTTSRIFQVPRHVTFAALDALRLLQVRWENDGNPSVGSGDVRGKRWQMWKATRRRERK